MRYEEGVYQALKVAGICTECRYRFAEPSSFLCWECREKNRKRNRENYRKKSKNPEFKKKEAERKRKRYQYLRDNGYCVKCGNKIQYKGTLCKDCWAREKVRYQNNKWKRKE